jgi:hypothetical protein
VVRAIYGSFLGGPIFPKPFNLLVPVNNGTVASSPFTFRWRRAIDLDPGDQVTYTVSLRSVSPDSTVFTTTTTDSFTVYSGYLGPSRTYEWSVTATDLLGHGRTGREPFRFTTGSTTGVDNTPPPSPPQVALRQNRPNPLRSLTTIDYALTGPSGTVPVTLRVFDARGRLIRTLYEGKDYVPSWRSFQWDGTGENGSRAASGIYYYELEVAGSRHSKRLVLVR